MRDLFVILGVFTCIGLFVYAIALVDKHYEDRGCQYVCEGNGDENAYRWDAGCWCRDEEGLYNPADSRDGRGKGDQ